ATRVLGLIGLYAMLALGLNIVVGFAGLLDLGYVAFYGIGSYTYALVASPQFDLHFNFWIALLIAVALAWPVLRTLFGAAGAPLGGTATFLRTGAELDEPLADGSLVRPGDTLGLDLRLSAPAHVYVLNEDQSGAVFALFPLAETDLANPLPADRRLRLPGARGAAVLSWEVTAGRGEERFLVIASRQPVAWLEEQLSGFAAPVSNPERTYRQLDPHAVDPDRGVGSVAESAPANPGGSVLEGLARRLTAGAADPSDLWLHHLMLYNLGR
ncbi:MAG: DUF4384 domain-containing protein, partial [Krumholzibacteria bacterium]|nr:DUF4384 domain-containing protein [Candidatus Krumholzibacteria bacterium]